jgi:chemotaxis protein MotA
LLALKLLIFNYIWQMLFYLGLVIVTLSVLVGFLLEGGNIYVLYQPFSMLIILGSAIGIFITSNSKDILNSVLTGFAKITNETSYKRDDYVSLLLFLVTFFRYSKTKSLNEIEREIEIPYKSSIFQEFPKFLAREEAVSFFCDYIRILTLGFDKSYELEQLIDDRINVKRHHMREVTTALYRLADALPALGIMAAVLGVTNAMGSIDAEAAVIGAKIGAALMGTFLGVAASYCLIHPFASFMEKNMTSEIRFFETIKTGIIAHVRGCTPTISGEFARQMVPVELQPSFLEIEKAIEGHRRIKKGMRSGRREQSAA